MSEWGKTYGPFSTAKKKRAGVAVRNGVAPSGGPMNASARSAQLAETLSRPDAVSPVSLRRGEIREGRTIAETLGFLGLPAAVLSRSGQLVAANKLFQALIPGTVREVNGLLRWPDPTADKRFHDRLSAIGNRDRDDGRQPIAVRESRGKPKRMVHLIPIPADTAEEFVGLGAIVVVSAVAPHSAPSLDQLRGLFDLSPAEARVAQGIAARCTVETIAARFGVSRETVRSQLKTVLAKTGTKRQLDLAVLLLESCRFHPNG